MRKSIVGIFFYRLIKIIYASPYGLSSPLVPEVSTLKIKLISIGVVGGMLRHQSPLLAGQFQSQRCCHSFGNRVLDCKYVGDFIIKSVRPERRTVCYPNQPHRYSYSVARPLYLPIQHRLHFLLSTSPKLVLFQACILTHCAYRPHIELSDLAQAGDQRVSHSHFK